jgi:outer membrane protein assembly factor BamA
MNAASGRAAVLLVFALLVPESALPSTHAVVDSAVVHAYGTVVDSIVVTGNRDTKSYVFVREMETHVGGVLVKEDLERDIRFINDMSPVATATVSAEVVAPGHSVVRIHIEERNSLFLTSILPFLQYDFETGVTYGVRWKDNNFRARLEQLNFTYTRNERGDNDVSFSWGAPWIGWRHISVGAQIRHFNRGDTPREIETLERSGISGSVALPLTDSRARFAQVIGSLSLDKTITGSEDTDHTHETLVSPTVGFRFDSRNSSLRPSAGQTLLLNVGGSVPVDVERRTNYWIRARGRSFHGVSDRNVIALLSDVFYQFGDFPEYSLVKLGGSGTLRGHPDSRFSGFHRWFGTIEWRYLYLPTKVVPMPIVRSVDVGLAFVSFVDTGIVWHDASDFVFERVHGTGGFGIRFYTPLRDVFRLDFGFNTRGDARFHFGTGIRF